MTTSTDPARVREAGSRGMSLSIPDRGGITISRSERKRRLPLPLLPLQTFYRKHRILYRPSDRDSATDSNHGTLFLFLLFFSALLLRVAGGVSFAPISSANKLSRVAET